MCKGARALQQKGWRSAWLVGGLTLLIGGGTSTRAEHPGDWPLLAMFSILPAAHAQAARVNPRYRPVAVTTEKGGQDFAISKVSPNVFIAPARGDARLELAFTTTVPDRRVGYSVSLDSTPEPGATPVDSAGKPIGPPIMIRVQSTFYGDCGVYSNPGAYTCTIRVPRDRFDSSAHQWEHVTVNVWSLSKDKDMSRAVPGAHNYDTLQKFTLKFTTVENMHAISRRIESGTNRYGGDYASRDLASAQACQSACASEAQCRAWTWVRPGVQGPGAKCWLKNTVPASSRNDCCVSGVK
jgi:hypothetical protein